MNVPSTFLFSPEPNSPRGCRFLRPSPGPAASSPGRLGRWARGRPAWCPLGSCLLPAHASSLSSDGQTSRSSPPDIPFSRYICCSSSCEDFSARSKSLFLTRLPSESECAFQTPRSRALAGSAPRIMPASLPSSHRPGLAPDLPPAMPAAPHSPCYKRPCSTLHLTHLSLRAPLHRPHSPTRSCKAVTPTGPHWPAAAVTSHFPSHTGFPCSS